MMALHHALLALQVLLLTRNGICKPIADGEVGCSLPPVKRGEKATLTCSYNFKLTPGVTVTVNGQGLHIGGSDKGTDIQVLTLEYTEEGWAEPTVHPDFKVRHISDVGDGMNWTVVIDIVNATEEYAGVYTCQLIGDRAPAPQHCDFFLDTLNTEIKSAASLLLHLASRLIKVVELRIQGSKEVRTIPLNPPESSFLLQEMQNNTVYEITVRVDQMDTPLARTVCLPAVGKLTTEAVNASSIHVQWEPPSCDPVATKFTYNVCYQKAESKGQLKCFPSEKTSVLASDLEVQTEYQILVEVMVDGKNVCSVAQRQSTTSLDKTADETKHGDSGEGHITMFISVAAVVVLIVVLVCITCFFMRKRLLTWCKQKLESGADSPEDVPLNTIVTDNQLPEDVTEEQADPPVEERQDEKFRQLEAEKEEIAEKLSCSVKKGQETEEQLRLEEKERCRLKAEMGSKDAEIASLKLEMQRVMDELSKTKDENQKLAISEAKLKEEKDEVMEARFQDQKAIIEWLKGQVERQNLSSKSLDDMDLKLRHEEPGACGGSVMGCPSPVISSGPAALSSGSKLVAPESSGTRRTGPGSAPSSSLDQKPRTTREADDTAPDTQSLLSAIKQRDTTEFEPPPAASEPSLQPSIPAESVHAQNVYHISDSV